MGNGRLVRMAFGRPFLAYCPLPIAYCLIALFNAIVIIRGKGMGEAIVRRREGLIELMDMRSPQAIKDGIDMGLPFIDRAIIADRLRQIVRIVKYVVVHGGDINKGARHEARGSP